MKRKLDLNIVENWASKVGGYDEAARQVSVRLECSLSKALKVVRGTYNSTPMPAEQMLLADLINVSRDDLFPLLTQGKSRSRNAS